MVLSSEEDNGCDNVGVVGNELSVKVHKAKEGVYSLDRGWRMLVSHSSDFCRIHVNETLTNNHSEVFHGGSIKGTFGNLERKAMLPETRQDSTSSLVM